VGRTGKTAAAADGADYGLLPRDKTFSQLLPAYLLPYAAYVGLGSLPTGLLNPVLNGCVRTVAVAALLWSFRKSYRFGPKLTLRHMLIAIGGAVAALALWVLAYRFSLALPMWRSHLITEGPAPSLAYVMIRAVNSALLVPVFEELFCRAYLGEFLFGLPADRSGPGDFLARLGRRMDAMPTALSAPPLSVYAVVGAAALFSLGHDMSAWIPAMLYFLFTSWLYSRTRSFRVCVAVHGLVNVAIAGLVYGFPQLRFLWF